MLCVCSVVGSCSINEENEPIDTDFHMPTEIIILGYEGNAMEPFISSDGQILFFNNPTENNKSGDIHYAELINKVTFDYMGLVQGVNTDEFEGAPSMDAAGNFYYTSLITYQQNFLSIYQGIFDKDTVKAIEPIDQNLTQMQPGLVDMDAVISFDGETLVLAIGKFTSNSFPDESNLIIASKSNDIFIEDLNSDEIMININSNLSEYAASLSKDGLELFFNRSNLPLDFKIMMATRATTNEAFGIPQVVEAIIGEATEGPSLSSDGRELYYHQKINSVFKIFKVVRN